VAAKDASFGRAPRCDAGKVDEDKKSLTVCVGGDEKTFRVGDSFKLEDVLEAIEADERERDRLQRAYEVYVKMQPLRFDMAILQRDHGNKR